MTEGSDIPSSPCTFNKNGKECKILVRSWSRMALAFSPKRKLVQQLPVDIRPPKAILLQWIGTVMQSEAQYAVQREESCKMARLFKQKQIRTYVLKGTVVSECYPNPSHRNSVDLDCFILSENGQVNIWEKGNTLIEDAGYGVKRDHYKNSTFFLPGLTVENHRFLIPFRGNKKLTELERVIESLIYADKGENRFDDTWLCRPPVMVSAIFLIEHAYSHFLHEGLTWRHILDWMMFSKKRRDEIDWDQLDNWINEFGFRKFYDSFFNLGQFLLGVITEAELSSVDKLMLADVWTDLDLHDSVRGLKGKMALAGNTWRARWKYKTFSEISMTRALWIQIKGFLFMKNPSL